MVQLKFEENWGSSLLDKKLEQLSKSMKTPLNDTNTPADPYTVLEVTSETLLHEIKAQYLKLVKLFHPDRQQHEGDKKYAAEQVFCII